MIGAAIAGTAALLQAATGLAQNIKGKKIQRSTFRPTYAIPEEIKNNLKRAEQEATYGLDAASKQIATQGIDRNTAAALYGGSSRRAGLAGLSGVVQSGNDAYSNLALMDAEELKRKKQLAMAMGSEMAGYKDKEWSINKFDPYQLKVDESQALIGAGMQNIGGALNTAASVGMTMEMNGNGTQRNTTGATGDPNAGANIMNDYSKGFGTTPKNSYNLSPIDVAKLQRKKTWKWQ